MLYLLIVSGVVVASKPTQLPEQGNRGMYTHITTYFTHIHLIHSKLNMGLH